MLTVKSLSFSLRWRTFNSDRDDVSAAEARVRRVNGRALVFSGIIRRRLLYQQFATVIHHAASRWQATGNT